MRSFPDSRDHGPAGRRGLVGALLLLGLSIGVVGGVGYLWSEGPPRWAQHVRPAGNAADTSDSAAPHSPLTRTEPGRSAMIATQVAPPTTPTGSFEFAGGQGAVFGTSGRVWRFRVGVEQGSNIAVSEFSELVEATLGNPQSWIAGGTVRFQRVPDGAAADVTIYLATPPTAQRLCQAGGVNTLIGGVPYTSCRVGGKVVVNLDRYQRAVPHYGPDLMTYRQYVINHEVGHFLGHGHEACPGRGQPAPTMQQQTLALAGCVPNAWPYLNGRRYAGSPTGP